MQHFGVCKKRAFGIPMPQLAMRNKNYRQAVRIMRITAFILLVGLLQVSAKSPAQERITLKEKGASLVTIFTQINKQTGYNFFFTNEDLKNAKPVDIEVKNATLKDVLDLCFKKQDLTYIISNKIITISKKNDEPVRDESSLPLPPPIDVRGKVVDENGKPLAGVTVTVKGTKKQTITDANGEFHIADVLDNAVLVFTSVNMESFELNVSGKKEILAKLKTKTSQLDEVQIIAYGTTTKRLNTGNVSTVKAADIEKQPVTNALLALEGRVAGMEIIQATGLPGTGVTVRIRGQNSISNGNDPLYVVDGVPYQSQMLPGLTAITGTSGSGNSYSTGNPLSYLNPGDVESIEVLKDADATAIYGTRAANGVVLITTKKGKVGPTRVDINIQQGWGNVTRFIPRLNTRQYLETRYEAYRNDGVDITTLTPNGSNYDLTLWDTTRYTDWNKELIGGTAKYSNVQLSLYGGNNVVQYRLGYNFNKQTTTFPGSFGNPKGDISFAVNSNSINKKLKVQLSGNYMVDKNSLPNYDLSEYTDLAPDAPALYNADGSLNWAPDTATGFPTWENPLAYLNLVYKRRVNNLVTNALFSYELLPGLEVKVSGGYTSMQSNEISTKPASAFAPILLPYVQRESKFASSQNDTWVIEPQLSFTTQLGSGRLSALVGATIQENNSKGQAFTGLGFNNDLVLEDIKAAASVEVNNTIDAVYKYNAIFGRLNYNYRDKYLINVTGRRDGTSRFGPNKRFANFGAAGIGWVFSQENFILKTLPFLSFGKIRGSYGTTGSDQVGDYQYLNLYNYVSYSIPYQNSLSLGLDGLFNPDLAWEETKKLEGAIELGFLHDKILLSASYYRNQCSNQLTSYELPRTTGAASIPANLDATVQNSGWEFTVNISNIRSTNFRWSSSINLTIPKNKLLSISPNAIVVDKRLVGRPLSTDFVYSFAGVDPATGVYQFYDGKGGLTFQPDTAIDPITNRLYSQIPLYTGIKYYGGFQNSFSWKNLQLDILFQFEKQLGQTNQRGRYPGSFTKSIGNHMQNQPVSILERWQKTGDNAPVQRYNQDFSIYKAFDYMSNSDAIWVDASYIRLKNVSLSWQLPEKIKKVLRLDNARVYTQAQNLFTILTYKGSDPETRSLISMPPLRMWTIGVQLTF
ncbi:MULTISPECIES: SusC/RagA family TonB-linked outer membrane protein [Niastella]|uniref:SusC/RagA family TonB-linked outer membrane protein n=1 Tax=Niastella soli TaxID=2821487 RepID=A0ABS3Z376_9BACT|nr:SusC/RagA family TonB-linked outer membrane protein [Niastella soli]MBO9204621.1 SusC/RagA family TonB-linked outer membrane protein [Niastella soli]